MKKIFWIVLLVLLLGRDAAHGQITVPNTFVAGQTASAAQVNANFSALGTNALNRSGGTLTGNITVEPGVTIDGVDLSAMFASGGGVTADRASLISITSPQLTIGYDSSHLMTFAVDAAGKLVIDGNGTGKWIDIETQLTVHNNVGITGSLTVAGGMGLTGTVSCASPCLAESAIIDGAIYPRAAATETISGQWTFSTPPIMTGGNITNILESNILNGALLARLADTETVTGAWRFRGRAIFEAPTDMLLTLGEFGESTNNKYWGFYTSGTSFYLLSLNDGLGWQDVGLSFSRTAGMITVATLAGASISLTGPQTVTTGFLRVFANTESLGAYVSVGDLATSRAPAYLQSGEPAVSYNHVIVSNNYYGVNGGTSARRNTSLGAAYIRLIAAGSVNATGITLNSVDVSNVHRELASFSPNAAIISASSLRFNPDGNAAASYFSINDGVNSRAPIYLISGVTGDADMTMLSNNIVDAGGGVKNTARGGSAITLHGDTAESGNSIDFRLAAPGGAGLMVPLSLIPTSISGNQGRALFSVDVLGNSSISVGSFSNAWQTAFLYTAPTIVSDQRVKTNIEPLNLGLAFIDQLQPKRYGFAANVLKGREKDRFLGFLAQDLLKAGFPGVDQRDPQHLGVRQEELLAPMVKAIQELHQEVKVLTTKVGEQQLKIASLQRQLNRDR